MPFLETRDKYHVACFLAARVFTRNGAQLFATIFYGRPIDPATVYANASPRDQDLMKCKCKEGNDLISFYGRWYTKDGKPRGANTRVRPDSWTRNWPGTVEGGERTLHKKVAKVRDGDDEDAKIWLNNMAWAYVLAQMSALVDMVLLDQRMFLDSLRGAVMLRAGMASEEGEREHAVAKILPAIDRAEAALAATVVHVAPD